MKKFDTTLYLVTDSTGLDEKIFLRKVEEALKGGVTILQLREKEKTTREYIYLAKKVHKLTEKYNVPLIIDDRIDVMLASGAEGVHLGKEDMEIDTAVTQTAERFGAKVFLPPLKLCGDNAAMIGAQGYYEYLACRISDSSLNASALDSKE